MLGRDFLAVEVWIDAGRRDAAAAGAREDLIAAWQSLLMHARMTQHHKVTREELSVREIHDPILRRLQGEPVHAISPRCSKWRKAWRWWW